MGRPSVSFKLMPALIAFSFVLAALVATAQDANQTAPSGGTDAAQPADYVITVKEVAADGHFSWSVKKLQFPPGSTVTLVYDSTGATGPHNLHAYDGAATTPKTEVINPDEGKVSITFTMPDSGTVKVRCDVHPEMEIKLTPGAFTGGGDAGAAGGHTGITALGVHYLAYWVGAIAFAVLFIIYGITFFLFKYNETPATTDHHDRTGAGAPAAGFSNPIMNNRALVLFLSVVAGIAIVIAVLWYGGAIGGEVGASAAGH